MIKVKRFDNLGKELASLSLNQDIFGVKVNNNLIHQAVVTQLANARWSNSHSKTRAEVAGSGKKPWRQKGTGRARSGSVRNPVWVGGGISFGPRNLQNFSKKFPKKMKRLALLQALSSKVQDKKLAIVDEFNFNKPKTKLAVKFIESLPEFSGTMLLVLSHGNSKVELAFRNLPYVKTILASNLNVVDILKYEWLIINNDAVKEIEKIFIKKKNISEKPEIIKEVKKESPKSTQVKTKKTTTKTKVIKKKIIKNSAKSTK